MSQEQRPANHRPLRFVALGASLSGLGFWLYPFYAIAQLPPGDGTGMQWVAVMPLGFIFFALTLPSLLLAIAGRALVIASTLGIVGVIAFAWLWSQLLAEFSGT